MHIYKYDPSKTLKNYWISYENIRILVSILDKGVFLVLMSGKFDFISGGEVDKWG